MATRLSNAARSAAADAVVDLLDAGSAAAYLEIRTGAQPAGPDSAATGTMLVSIDLGDPAYGAASNGVAAMSGTPSGTGAAAGTAGWFRMYDSDDTAILDGDVTATSGGGDLELDNTSIAVSQTVTITSMPYTQPASE